MGPVQPASIVPTMVDPKRRTEDAIDFPILSGKERKSRSRKVLDRGFEVEGSMWDEDFHPTVHGPMQFHGKESRKPDPVYGFP